jgi:hypothetical protein
MGADGRLWGCSVRILWRVPAAVVYENGLHGCSFGGEYISRELGASESL